MPLNVGIIGALNIDLIIRGKAPVNIDDLNKWAGPSDVYCLTAGSIGYFAQNFANLGAHLHLVSTVGDDPYGELMICSIKKKGIHTEHIIIEPNTQSAIGIYMLLFESSKRPLTYRLPTHHGFPPSFSSDAREFLLNTDLLHCGGYLHFPDLWTGHIASIFAEAKKIGLRTSLDPQFPLSPLEPPWSKVLSPILKNTDILLIDENEAMGIAGKKTLETAIPVLWTLGVETIAIKLGEKGAIILHGKETITQPVVKVPPEKFVDSIGAGDSFDAGFLYGIMKNKSIQESASIAAYVAAKSCEGVGGSSSFPSADQLPK